VNFNVTYDSSVTSQSQSFQSMFHTAVNAALSFYESEFTNNITVNITFAWGATSSNAVAENSFYYQTYSYAQIVSALKASGKSADDIAAYATLPASDPTGSGHAYALTTAQAKALGLSVGYTPPYDDFVTLGSGYAWTFDPNNRAVAGEFDAIGALEHEISEGVFGRIGSLGSASAGFGAGIYTPLDLFRYSAPGVHDYSNPGANDYFSIDGTHLLTEFNNHNQYGGDVSDWYPTVQGDSFGDAYHGVAGLVTPTDLRELDVLGWNLAQPNTLVGWANQQGEKVVVGNFASSVGTDIAVMGAGQGGIGTYVSNGDGTFHTVFSPQTATQTDWDSWPTAHVIAGDFLGNGRTDVAVINPGQGGIATYLANSDGTFQAGIFSAQAATHTDWVSWPNPQIVTGDFDGNGRTDLAVINPGQGGIATYLSNGNGTFTAEFSAQVASHTDWDSLPNPQIVTGDFDGNGRTDLAVINPGQGGIATYLSSGNGTFTAVFSSQVASHTDWDSWPDPKIVTGDFLGNGRTDLAVINPGQGGIATYLSNGDGTFTAVFSPQTATHTDWESWQNAKIVAGDFLGNGRTDLAVINPGQGGIATYLSNGDGTFTAVFSPQTATHTDWDSWPNPQIVIGDFDGNGRTDIAVINPGQGGLATYLSNGNGTFTAKFTATGASGTALSASVTTSNNTTLNSPLPTPSLGAEGDAVDSGLGIGPIYAPDIALLISHMSSSFATPSDGQGGSFLRESPPEQTMPLTQSHG
jgi:DNA/RNA endonuclease YhcR with UshA esterase domain